MNIEAMKQTVVSALEDIKARDIVVMHVAKLTPIADYMIVASGDSARQTKALARNVMEKIEEAGGEVMGIEGEENGEWVLLDLGGIIVHIMHPAVREYYNLEELWGASPSRSRKTAGSAQ
jgi:ribosome-associated protein